MAQQDNQGERETAAKVLPSQVVDQQWFEVDQDLASGETLKARKWETERRLVDDSSSYGNLHRGAEEDKELSKDEVATVKAEVQQTEQDSSFLADREVHDLPGEEDRSTAAGTVAEQTGATQAILSRAVVGGQVAFNDYSANLQTEAEYVSEWVPRVGPAGSRETAFPVEGAPRSDPGAVGMPVGQVQDGELVVPDDIQPGSPLSGDLAEQISRSPEQAAEPLPESLLEQNIAPEKVAAVIQGPDGEIQEDDAGGISGRLTILDPDAGESHFRAATSQGSYGSLNLAEDGNWSYVLDNDSQAVQSLAPGQMLTDTLCILAADGTSHDLSITIHGANDAPRIGTITSQTASEDGEAVSGRITAADVDAGDTVSYSTSSAVDGLLFAADGSYTFDPGHARYQGLAAGETQAIIIPVTATDSYGGTATENLIITLKGGNDLPTVSGAVSLPGGSEDMVQTFTADQLLAQASDRDISDHLSISEIAVDPALGTLTCQNGVFTFTPVANYHGEVTLSYTIADTSGATVQGQASLNLAAVNDPIGPLADIDSSGNTVLENAANGTVVHVTTRAVDVDGDAVSYALVDGTGKAISNSAFAVDASSGVVTVRDHSRLDYETAASQQLHIQATSSDGSTSTEAFTVTIGDARIMQVTDLGGAGDGTPVTLNISGDHYDPKNIDDAGSAGAPQFRIKVNGEYLNLNGQTTFTASANTGHLVATGKDLTGDGANDLQMVYNANDSELFTFRVPAGTPVESVSVQFLNDAYDGSTANNDKDNVIGEDRNLVVREMNIGGTIQADGTIIGGTTYQAEDKVVSQYLSSSNTDVSGRETMAWSGTMTFYPDGVPVAPTSEDSTLATVEDTAVTLTVGDFHFADTNAGDSLAAVRITNLDGQGSLALAGHEVGLNQEISRADIDAGRLIYTPAADVSGEHAASLAFQVSDGQKWSAGSNTLSLDISPVTDEPIFAVSPVEGAAGTTFAIPVQVSPGDLDGSETLGPVTISGVPPGAVLSAGTMISGGEPADYQATTLGIQEAGPLSVVFGGETAGYQNSFGYYKINPETKEITDVEMIWTNASLKNSGGSLVASESAADLDATAGDTLGFFIVANGNAQNSYSMLGSGHYEFRARDGGDATTDSASPKLVFVGADGMVTAINGDVFHTVDGTDNYSLNPDGIRHTTGVLDLEQGNVTIGFEDLRGGGDRDFDDCIFTVHIGQANTGALSATNQGYSTWQLAPEELEGLQISLPDGSKEDFSLTFSVTSTEVGGETATTTTVVPVSLVEDRDVSSAGILAVGSDLPSISLDEGSLAGTTGQDDGSSTELPGEVSSIPQASGAEYTTDIGGAAPELSASIADTESSVHDIDIASDVQNSGSEAPAEGDSALQSFSADGNSGSSAAGSDLEEKFGTNTGDGSEDAVPAMDASDAPAEAEEQDTPESIGVGDGDVTVPDESTEPVSGTEEVAAV